MTTHENLSALHAIKMGSNKNFCLTFGVIFLLLGCYLLLVQKNSVSYWLFGVAGVFFLLAFTKPNLVMPLNRGWLKFGVLLGRVMLPIIMGLLYFTVFLITGLLLKLFKKDSLKLKCDPSASTYWCKREDSTFTADGFKDQF